MRLLAVAGVAACVLGGWLGWHIGSASAPSNRELLTAARQLVPETSAVDLVEVLDRPASLSNPPWDLAGSRYAQVTFRPRTSGRAAVERDVAAAARARGWDEDGATTGGARRWSRPKMTATLELDERGPEATFGLVRVRPRSWPAWVGFWAGLVGAPGALLAVAAAARAMRRRR